VIQNTQSRDTQAMQLKLDELIRANRTAHNSLINLEEMSENDLERMKAAFAKLAAIETPTKSAETPTKSSRVEDLVVRIRHLVPFDRIEIPRKLSDPKGTIC